MTSFKKIALITGITGQDGAYLSQFLLQRNYRVIGLIRSSSGSDLYRLRYLNVLHQIELQECDLQDISQLIKIIIDYQPDEIYNLAAQSSVSLSFRQPIGTLHYNVNTVLNILESIRLINPKIRFYQASSSEMYGKVDDLPITEESRPHPLSPYAISKVTAHYTTINYRESYNLYACCGILFNHESYLRGRSFFIKKVILGALDIKYGKATTLEVGNLDIKRDFGHSKKYIEVMWMMLQQVVPDDFVICSGRSIYLREIVEFVFEHTGVPYSAVAVNPKLFRPTEIEEIYGSSEKARKNMNWVYDIDFRDTLVELIEEEERHYPGARTS